MAFVAAAEAGAGRAAAGRAAGSAAGRGAGRKAAAAKGAPKGAKGAGSRSLVGVDDAAQVNEELQRRRQEAADAKATRQSAASSGPVAQAAGVSQPAPKPDKGRPSPVRGMEPASSGAGFVLGLLVWTVAVNYVQGGVPQVRRLLAAKFLNKTD